MPYLPNINSYLHQSSLLLQAYPDTTRITTKYSLPQKQKQKTAVEVPKEQSETSDAGENRRPTREQQPPAATLTFKTFETTAGICLKYQTNKSAEVGRLMTGLGKLAKGEVFEESSVAVTGVEATDTKAEDMLDADAQASKGERVPDGASGGAKSKKKKGRK